jgi:cytochrome c-type biogenesis protein CcmH
MILWAAALLALAAIAVALTRRDADRQPIQPVVAASANAADPLADLQRRVAQHPGDSNAWRELGEAQFAHGAYADAIPSLEKAAQISPKQAILWSSLGEARVMASEHDPMPGEALADFHRAQAADPSDPRSRYFLAVKQDLSGDHQGAITAWLALLKATPVDAPWRSDLIRTIKQVGAINHIAVAGLIVETGGAAPTTPAQKSLPGPTPQDLAAATALPPSQQRQMAEGMVERLDARLKAQPGDPDGWIMLIRSRAYLGQTDKAAAALGAAVVANPGEAEQLRAAAAAMGVR